MKRIHHDCVDAYPRDTADLLPHLPEVSRRRLLKLMGATGATGAASALLAPLTALAQTTPAPTTRPWCACSCTAATTATT